MTDRFDVVVVGAGAAGIGAGLRLARTPKSFVLLEARDRVGGRSHTLASAAGPLDLGCEWLHSARDNIWTVIAQASGFHVAQTPAPWERQTGDQGFPRQDQRAFRQEMQAFEARIEAEAEQGVPRAMATFLESHGRYNHLIEAVFSYIGGGALSDMDARDYARYEDSGINWRVREGYGALIAATAQTLPVRLNTEVRAIDFAHRPIRIDTSRGALEADQVIVTVPTSILARIAFNPALPEKIDAAAGLPLGNAEKLYFALDHAEDFPIDGHFFGGFDRAETGSYHFRTLGRPVIESYFGGALAVGLATAGEAAMDAFAREELSALLGSDFLKRIRPLAATNWVSDPWAMGSYSYARTGCAEMRAVLAAPVDGRVFFAGEACSKHRFSTAHGAFQTGYEAAVALLQESPRA